MKFKVNILCPEYVPLENKGEEAIIRGIIDVLYPALEIEYHIVDNNSKKYYMKDGIHVHPGGLFFSDWRSREFGLGPSWNQLYSSCCSLLRNGLNKFFPWWIHKPHVEASRLKKYITDKKKVPNKYKESIELLKNIDYVIAGHNGGLDEYVCHILNELWSINIPYGIFGSSMKPNLKQKSLLNIFRRTFEKSDFNITRNPIGHNWALKNFPNVEFTLNPDPAFGMLPISDSEAEKILESEGLTYLFDNPVIMITTAEPAPIARHSFNNIISPIQKIEAHRNFLKDLILLIYNNTNFNLLFLPHTIGPNKGMDDRIISKDVVQRANLVNDKRIIVMERDLTAKELKGIIKKADFLIGERVHSIIGAIGVQTPFMSLASKADIRVEGILKQQMKCSDNIYYLNSPDSKEAYELFIDLFNKRENLKKHIEDLNVDIQLYFNDTRLMISNIISEKINRNK